METVREKMIRLMDMLIAEVEKIEKKENQTLKEILVLTKVGNLISQHEKNKHSNTTRTQ